MKTLGTALLGCSTIALLGLMVFGVTKKIEFSQNCSGYLKRAADANSIELAEQELGRAIEYLERENLTEGSTHCFYAVPSNDIAFWYQNLKSAHLELQTFPTSADHLTVSNHLMKLRETLVDVDEDGPEVTKPPAIAVYPNQLIFNVGIISAFAGTLFGLTLMGVCSHQNPNCKSKF